VLDSELAYGIDGRPPKVLPNAPVRFELELVDWSSPLPRFPSPEEIAVSKREREDEDRRRMEEHPAPTVAERLADADKARLEGNAAFKLSDYAKAKKDYDRAFVYLYFSTEEVSSVVCQLDSFFRLLVHPSDYRLIHAFIQ
jgi:hypothetical protein